jgi:predicted unusual protein kinase regulating ubiquinone biosynthesis (AarF/ABC1/UbiB family)
LLQTPNGDLAYLDFGMMSEVPAKQRYALIGTVLGLVNKDIKMVVENLNILQFFDANTNTDLVISTLNTALNDATDGGRGSASTLNFTRLNQNLESASASLPFRAPPFYTLIVRTLTILEGLALYIDPKFRLIRGKLNNATIYTNNILTLSSSSGAYPFVAKQILSDPNTELVELLSAIILSPDKKIRWDKLEKFLSIASSADDALAGDFEALKDAQEKSDLIRTYSGSTQQQSNVTVDVTVRVMDFLLRLVMSYHHHHHHSYSYSFIKQ